MILKGKAFVRVDFNVPLNHNRQVTDDTRICANCCQLLKRY